MCRALSVSFFTAPNEIAPGGVTGLATMLNHLVDLPIGATALLLNIPLLIWGVIESGRRFIIRTMIITVAVSLLIDLFSLFRFAYHGDLIIAAIFGGILSGVGLGLIFLRGGSTGGTDIIAMIVCKYRNISQGRVILILDIVIIACGLIVGNTVEDFIYSCVVMGVCSYCIDLVLTGNKQTVQAFIFTSKPEKVADRIANEMQRGVTMINGTGWYTKNEGPILMVVAHKRESQQILRIVKDEDPKAFMTMNTVMGAYGKGFEQIKH